MKNKLLAIGSIFLLLGHAKSQNSLYVMDKGVLNVKEDATLNTYTSVDVNSGGLVNVSGIVKVVAGSTGHFKTGGKNHFILHLNAPANYATSTYGQLYISEIGQSNITGIVDKQYRDASHGKYQQLGLPFYDKKISDLNTEIPGLGLTDVRFIAGRASGENLLLWNNALVREDLKSTASTTTNGLDYFILGAKNLADSYFPTTTSTLTGRPYSDCNTCLTQTLADAGKDVNFGTDGNGLNTYRQRYKNYVVDNWAKTDGENWTGNYARNIYQFANPFLTNIDLMLLNSTVKSEIRGIRYSVSNSSTNMANTALQYKYINFTVAGGAVGDVEAPIIKPLQEFVIKLKSNNVKPSINFATLRTFAYKSATGVTSGTTVGSSFRNPRISKLQNSGSVKQLEVLLLDENKNEIDRTYYVVYPEAQTGLPTEATVQVAASKSNAITTFEESAEGGIDNAVKDTYRLYINEANEKTFYGRRIPVVLFDEHSNGQKNNAAFIKINVRDNMKFISENTSTLSSGESFYVNINNKVVEARQGLVLPLSGDIFGKADAIGLYYGKPVDENTLSTTNVIRLSDTKILLDHSDNKHKVYFDSSWKKASVEVYDMSGKLVYSAKNIDTTAPYTLDLDNVNGVYTVKVVSENSEIYVQKIRN